MTPFRLAVLLQLAATTSSLAQCAITTSNIIFPSTNPSSGSVSTGSAKAVCPGGYGSFPYLWACFGVGVGGSSVSEANRTMASGANKLAYQIYTDSSYATPYKLSPPSLQFSVPYSNTTGAVVSTTLYAKVLPGQTSPPGTYTDTYNGAAQAEISGNAASSLPGNCLGAFGPLNFTVSATVPAVCTISATDMNFGSAASLSANIDATSTINILCTNTTPYYVNLSYGSSYSSTRRMSFGSNKVNYNLFQDFARSLFWGPNYNVDGVSGTGIGVTQNLTVYGRVFSGQATPPSGSYADTITATVTY